MPRFDERFQRVRFVRGRRSDALGVRLELDERLPGFVPPSVVPRESLELFSLGIPYAEVATSPTATLSTECELVAGIGHGRFRVLVGGNRWGGRNVLAHDRMISLSLADMPPGADWRPDAPSGIISPWKAPPSSRPSCNIGSGCSSRPSARPC